MSTKFHKQIKTKKNKEELKHIIDEMWKNLPILNSVLDKFEWQDDTLIFDSKFGDGFVQVMDYLVVVDINLNFIGSLAKGRLESVLDEEFLKLDK